MNAKLQFTTFALAASIIIAAIGAYKLQQNRELQAQLLVVDVQPPAPAVDYKSVVAKTSSDDILEATQLREAQLEAQQTLNQLNAELEFARLQANPYYDSLKEVALGQLEEGRQRWVSLRRGMQSQIRNLPQISRQQIQTEHRVALFGYALDNLDIDSATRDTIIERLQENSTRTYELEGQYRSGVITQAEYESELARFSESKLWSEMLTETQLSQFNALEEKRQENGQLANSFMHVSVLAGALSEDSKTLLIEGFTALNQVNAVAPQFSSDKILQKRLDDLTQLQQWMETQIPEQDRLGVTNFIESQKVSAEQAHQLEPYMPININ